MRASWVTKTWLTIGRPSSNAEHRPESAIGIEPQEGLVVCATRKSVLSLNKYLAGDLFVIGGARILQDVLGVHSEMDRTEVPLVVEGADAFMPDDYLEGFERWDQRELDDQLL